MKVAELTEVLGGQERESMGTYKTKVEYAVGKVGHTLRGDKIHLLRVERIIEVTDPKVVGDRRKLQLGDALSTGAPCNGNGQHVGRAWKQLDTEHINCQKCQKVLAQLVERAEAKKAELKAIENAKAEPVKASSAIIGVKYEEGKPETYKGIELCLSVAQENADDEWGFRHELFMTGDPDADYNTAVKRALACGCATISVSSTVDFFEFQRGKDFEYVHEMSPEEAMHQLGEAGRMREEAMAVLGCPKPEQEEQPAEFPTDLLSKEDISKLWNALKLAQYHAPDPMARKQFEEALAILA